MNPTTRGGAITGVIRAVDSTLFRGFSAARRSRIFHPDGAAFEAELQISADVETPDAPLLKPGTRYDAVVRFSRGVGLPEPTPDVLGLAIKLRGAHDGGDQDFLMVTSGTGTGANRLLLPVRSFFARPYSTVLGYDAGGQRVLFGALPPVGGSSPASSLAELRSAASEGGLEFAFAFASAVSPWRPIGTLSIGDELAEDDAEELRFNPWNSGGGVRPAGAINWLRDAAYRGSQLGRPR